MTEATNKRPVEVANCARCDGWIDDGEEVNEEGVCRPCILSAAAAEVEAVLLPLLQEAHMVRSTYYGGSAMLERAQVDAYIVPLTTALDLVRDIQANVEQEADPFDMDE